MNRMDEQTRDALEWAVRQVESFIRLCNENHRQNHDLATALPVYEAHRNALKALLEKV